jgi:hypothetical protein
MEPNIPQTLPPDCHQAHPLVNGLAYHLYRRPYGTNEEYHLRIPTALVLYHGDRLYRADSTFAGSNHDTARPRLCEYSTVLQDRDILLPTAMTPELQSCIDSDEWRAEERQQQAYMEQLVMSHPLYIALQAELSGAKERLEQLEQDVLAGEKLYGVDAILLLDSKCSVCYGQGKRRPWDEDACCECNGTGNYYRVFTREPGVAWDGSEEHIAEGRNQRETIAEALDVCRATGWRHILMPDGKRRKLHRAA